MKQDYVATNVLGDPRLIRDLVERVTMRLCEIIDAGQRPSAVEGIYGRMSFALNSRVEHIGRVYNEMRRTDHAGRILEAESLLSDILYSFRKTLSEYDQRIVTRIDAFLKDEVIETEVARG